MSHIGRPMLSIKVLFFIHNKKGGNYYEKRINRISIYY